jgi:hypothetical protein
LCLIISKIDLCSSHGEILQLISHSVRNDFGDEKEKLQTLFSLVLLFFRKGNIKTLERPLGQTF